jgi:tRNA (guanine9-N1)-methyltransferase
MDGHVQQNITKMNEEVVVEEADCPEVDLADEESKDDDSVVDGVDVDHDNNDDDDHNNDQEHSLTLSKKDLQRLRRKEFFQQVKQSKKLKKKAERQQKLASGEIQLPKPSDPALVPPTEVIQQQRLERKQAKVDAYLSSCRENFEVIIDCAWESEHNDSTLSSLTQQMMFCYGLNRRYPKPSFLHLANLSERTHANLSKVKFENWLGVTTAARDYVEETDRFTIGPASDGKKQLVYLTSDAEETLDTLDPSHAYIIGGIVDRNRLKGVTYYKALGQGVRTAKLPIKEHFSLSATHVLTVNHVYEILLKYNMVQNWPETLSSILPKRKVATVREDLIEEAEGFDNNDDIAPPTDN